MKKVTYAKMVELINKNCKNVFAKKSSWYEGVVCIDVFAKDEKARSEAISFVFNNYLTTAGNSFLMVTNISEDF